MAADRITLTGLRVFGRHGVLDHERADGQEFVVDLDLVVDIAEAAERDDLAATVDYSAIAQVVADIVGGEPRDLIETVATEIADVIVDGFDVDEVTVVLHKPEAPIPHPFADVSVTVTRP